MGVPGASQSILESYVPYSRESLDIHLNKKPDHYCSQATSLHMASLAYKKALKISDIDKKYLFGIAVTASLKSNYNKLGEHRFHIALQNEKQTVVINCILEKNKRSREEEENLLSTFILNLINQSSNLPLKKVTFPNLEFFSNEMILFSSSILSELILAGLSALEIKS